MTGEDAEVVAVRPEAEEETAVAEVHPEDEERREVALAEVRRREELASIIEASKRRYYRSV